MIVITIQSEAFQELLQKIEAINQTLSQPPKSSQETFLNKTEFIKLMKISSRLAQSWRDQGIISFSQVQNKIYYKLSDVEGLLDKHSKKAFKNLIVGEKY
jgi:3-methyladenine DNA glycosylase Tag